VQPGSVHAVGGAMCRGGRRSKCLVVVVVCIGRDVLEGWVMHCARISNSGGEYIDVNVDGGNLGTPT
jgi:hypothetical protein